MITKQDIETLIEKKVVGGFFYGSRVAGFARAKSDLDACFIVESSDPFNKEIHGIKHIGKSLVNTEFCFYDLSTLKQSIGDDILLMFKIAESKGFLQNTTENEIIKSAKSKIALKKQDFLNEISEIDVDDYIQLFQVSFSEGFEVLNDKRLQQNQLAYTARAFEYLSTYFLYAQILKIKKDVELLTEKVMKTLLLMQHIHSLRVYDVDKFNHIKSFQNLIKRINDSIGTKDLHIKIWSELDNHFEQEFGRKLITNEVKNEIRAVN